MKKSILIIIFIILLFVIAILFVINKYINNNSIININPKRLELTYEINAGIPYKWEYEIADNDIVEFVKSYVVKDENTDGKVGASVYTNYVFKGIKEGTTTITFKFVNFVDGKIEEEKKHIVKVDKDNNISLI